MNAGEDWNLSEDEPLSENEYVVGEILNRRLVFETLDTPRDQDYEYLVQWEGYGSEENTWEPYENLKHCTKKMNEFFDQLRRKALKSRKGKH